MYAPCLPLRPDAVTRTVALWGTVGYCVALWLVSLLSAGPFKPMLAKRKVRKTCLDSMKNSAFIIEKKWDGERMLIHKNGKEVKYFTRNCNDYTALYGAALTPHVLECVKADKAILDAEVRRGEEEKRRREERGGENKVQSTEYKSKLCVVAHES